MGRTSTKLQITDKCMAAALLAMFVFYQLSCTSAGELDDIVITGDLLNAHSNLEGKKLYFGENSSHEFLDSTTVHLGKFRFQIKPGYNFVPFKCSILYATGDPTHPYNLIGYKNPYLDKYYESILYADRGKMHLTRDSSSIKIPGKELFEFKIDKPNKQTHAAFLHLSFKENKNQSAESRKFNIELVKKYPYSLDLISQLEWAKQKVTDHELSELLGLFDQSARQAPAFKKMQYYISYQNSTGNLFPADLELEKPDGSRASNVLSPDANYNLVVFWASWCGPCRQEIPAIKALYEKHNSKLSITSISVDKKGDAWKKALTQEKMPWNQYLANDEAALAVLDKKYDLGAIPVWLLFDSKNNLIDKQVGFYTGKDGINGKVESHLTKF